MSSRKSQTTSPIQLCTGHNSEEELKGRHLATNSGSKIETSEKKVKKPPGQQETDRSGEPSLLPYTPKA
jgi:hypothetical protein